MSPIARVTALVAVLLASSELRAQYAWTGSQNSLWSNPNNWDPTNGPPNGIGVSTTFGTTNSYSNSVTIDTGITVGSILFGPSSEMGYSTYDLTAGGGSLTLDNGASASSITAGPFADSARLSANLTVAGNGLLDLSAPAEMQYYQRLTLGGAITASGGTVAVNQGRVALLGTNTYTSVTRVDAGGVLEAVEGVGLSPNTNLVLNGGRLATDGVFARNLGGGPGEVSFTGSGGFGGAGSVQVRLNNGTGTLAWGSTPHFLGDGSSLVLGTGYYWGGSVDFQNGLDLNGQDRTIRAEGYGNTISGAIGTSSGTAGVVKAGTGWLYLTGSNTYNGPTTVAAGVLVAGDGAGLPSSSNLVLNGGVYSTDGADFTRSLGAGAGQVRFGPAGGGFAAYTSQLAVRLNNNSGTVTWGSGGFVPSGAALILGVETGGGARSIFRTAST
jgi:autotransporter-associated beta strand protein